MVSIRPIGVSYHHTNHKSSSLSTIYTSITQNLHCHIYTLVQQYDCCISLSWICKSSIILMDHVIKHLCIWPLAWRNKYKRRIHQHFFSNFLPFHSPVKEKEKQGRMKGLTTAQWKNFNRNNRSVLARWYSVLREKIGLILLPLVGLMAGRPADEIGVGFEILKILYR